MTDDRPAGDGESVEFRRRPRPSDDDLKVMAERREGRHRYLAEPSDGWWERGALLVDSRGPALIDADGQRRDFPPWTVGAWLIFNRWWMSTGSNMAEITGGFLAAPNPPHPVLLNLPTQGFEEKDFRDFASRAGLFYRDTAGAGEEKTEQMYPGMTSRRTPSWKDAVFTREDRDHRLGARLRHRLAHPFGGTR